MLFLKIICTFIPPRVTAPSKLIHGPGEFSQSKADTVACRFIGSERLVVTICSARAAGASARLNAILASSASLFRCVELLLNLLQSRFIVISHVCHLLKATA